MRKGRKEGTERSQAHPPLAQDTRLNPSLLPKVPRATRAHQAPPLARIEEGRLSPWRLRLYEGTQDPLSSFPGVSSRSRIGQVTSLELAERRRTRRPQLRGDLPVRHSWHRLACPGVEAECSYSVETEEEKAKHKPTTPVLMGQNTTCRCLEPLPRKSLKQDQNPDHRGTLPRPLGEALGKSGYP